MQRRRQTNRISKREQIGLIKVVYNFLDGNVDKIVGHTKIDKEHVERIIQELKAEEKL